MTVSPLESLWGASLKGGFSSSAIYMAQYMKGVHESTLFYWRQQANKEAACLLVKMTDQEQNLFIEAQSSVSFHAIVKKPIWHLIKLS